jgi:hypothetical protein
MDSGRACAIPALRAEKGGNRANRESVMRDRREEAFDSLSSLGEFAGEQRRMGVFPALW